MTEDTRDGDEAKALEGHPLQDEELCEFLQVVWPRSRSHLDDIAEKTGILEQNDGPEAIWRFRHWTFREALTSEQLASAYDSDGKNAIVEHAGKSPRRA